MSKTTELVERLRELPRDTRKATVEIYDLCIEASYKIEELTDRCARYAEEIAVLQGENSVTVVCGLRGLTVTVSEKREAWIQSGMSSSVLGQVSEKWNGLTDERRVDGETPADVGERDREQLSHGPRS